MRIQSPTHSEIARSESKDREATGASKAESGSENAKGDIVSLGATAKRLAVSSRSTLEPEIQARLELVRAQIKNNEYAIDYGKLASNILGDEVARGGAE